MEARAFRGRGGPNDGGRCLGLTPREREVLALLAAGCSDKAIARRLGISVKTAGHHASRIYKKTGTQGRAQVAIFATENKALLA